MMYMLFVEEIEFSVSINEGLNILNQGKEKGTSITEEFESTIKQDYHSTINELFDMDEGPSTVRMTQFVIMVMTGFIV